MERLPRSLQLVRRRILETLTRDVLRPRKQLWNHLFSEIDTTATRLREHQERLADAQQALDRGPFRPEHTVHEAHRRHPGVAAIFQAYGLPDCPGCAVGADETLAEAAFGERLPLERLLAELNSLREAPPRRSG